MFQGGRYRSRSVQRLVHELGQRPDRRGHQFRHFRHNPEYVERIASLPGGCVNNRWGGKWVRNCAESQVALSIDGLINPSSILSDFFVTSSLIFYVSPFINHKIGHHAWCLWLNFKIYPCCHGHTNESLRDFSRFFPLFGQNLQPIFHFFSCKKKN